MLVLVLDTSTPVVTAGVVLVRRPPELLAELAAGRTPEPLAVLAQRTVDSPFAHAEQLIPLARRALADAGHTLRDVEAVVVGLGPGPFTGLRVGIATAAALGDALDLPVHGVPSHDAIARTVRPESPGSAAGLVVVTDARRREVYLSGYAADGRRIRGPEVLAPAAVVTDAAAVTGAGAPLVAALNLPVLDATIPLAAGLAGCAVQALLTGTVPGPLTPLYLRRPDAVPPKPRTVLTR